MTKKPLYTARDCYDPQNEGWKSYLSWSKLSHLKELVSLDYMLNGLAFEAKHNGEGQEHIDEITGFTGLYRSLEYVLTNTKEIDHFNLIATIIDPPPQKSQQLQNDFEFVGYELLDTLDWISALSNCGGFDETFSPSDLNEYGLVSDYEKAKKFQKDLIVNNPDEHHADCNLFEVWRHKKIGRKASEHK